MESFWLCDDCQFAAAYEDYSALSLYYPTEETEKRLAALPRGLMHLMPLSADFDAEAGWGINTFSSLPCDGCGSPRSGQRHQYTRL